MSKEAFTRSEMREVLEWIVARCQRVGHIIPGETWVVIDEHRAKVLAHIAERLKEADRGGEKR